MKFSINSTSLEKLLSKVIPAIPPRTPMPVIENFLFQIQENLLTVTGTDLDMFITCTMSIDADGEFESIIPARLFYDLVRSIPDSIINFEVTGNGSLNMRTDFGSYQIGYADSSQFPQVPAITYTKQVTIIGSVLKNAIDLTSFAVSKEPMRPAMTGILFDFTDEGLKFVATDGHRLVRFIYKPLTFEEADQIVVPIKAVDVLLKFAGDSPVSISYTNSNILFRFGEITMISSLINQKYPAYNSVIPLENDNLLTLDKKPLIGAVKRMLLFDSSNFPKVKIGLSENMVEISSEDIDKGSRGTETLQCDYTGVPMEIAFNTHFLYDILSHMEQEKLVFRFESPSRASLIEGAEAAEDREILMLLMPVRLNV
ncbi:MAG: DNA polymerase III subunit beta [Ignavibacteria bacterium]|nr:DNA polymerase III subunit beta [Ignavibacteria bacterium]